MDELWFKPRFIVQQPSPVYANDMILDYKTNDLSRVMKIANQNTAQT